MEFVDLHSQQQRIKPQIDAAIQKVLAHGKYILGPEVAELEEKLSIFTGSKYCITCANGTDALQIALMALGVGQGDEVIVPAFSFIATAEAVAIIGACPVFVDVDINTYNIDANKIESAITDKTKAILPVSLFGQCADFTRINSIANKYGLPVVEDAAQSFGAIHRGSRSCNVSDIGCTSFFPAKPLGCYGDGGAIFTSSEDLATRIRQIARHGQSKRYYHDVVGMNSRLDTIQAAILLEKLKIYNDEIERRGKVASNYIELFGQVDVALPSIDEGNTSVYAQFTLSSKRRDYFVEELIKNNIPSFVHYPYPLHKQPVFALTNSNVNNYVSESLAKQVFSLPMHPYLSKSEQEKILSVIFS